MNTLFISRNATRFVLFSLSHFVSIAIIIAACVLIFSLRNQLKNHTKIFELILIFILISSESTLHILRYLYGAWWLSTSLPLHLCGASIILCIILLISKSYKVYEIAYFWGLIGATQALLTPDLALGFPDIRYIQFFVAHGAIITTIVYMTAVYNFRPFLKSIPKVIIITNLYLIFVAIINILTEGNYMYLSRKPIGASLLDFMGNWPWYLISLQFVGIISFLIYYLPFLIKDKRSKKKRDRR